MWNRDRLLCDKKTDFGYTVCMSGVRQVFLSSKGTILVGCPPCDGAVQTCCSFMYITYLVEPSWPVTLKMSSRSRFQRNNPSAPVRFRSSLAQQMATATHSQRRVSTGRTPLFPVQSTLPTKLRRGGWTSTFQDVGKPAAAFTSTAVGTAATWCPRTRSTSTSRRAPIDPRTELPKVAAIQRTRLQQERLNCCTLFLHQ